MQHVLSSAGQQCRHFEQGQLLLFGVAQSSFVRLLKCTGSLEHLNGFVVRRGEALGVPVPANRALCALVKLLETKAVASRAASP